MGGRCTKVNNPGYYPGNYSKTDGIQCYTLSDKVEIPPMTELRSHCEDDTNTATTSTGYITVIGEQQIIQEEMTHSVENLDRRRKRCLLDERDYLWEELRLKEENIRRDYEFAKSNGTTYMFGLRTFHVDWILRPIFCNRSRMSPNSGCDLEMEVTMLRKKLCLLKEKEILMQDIMNTADDFKRKFGKDVEQADDNSELYKKLISVRLKTSIMDKINSYCETSTRMESPREEGTWTKRNSRDPKRDSSASACKCSADMANLLPEIESIIAREIRKIIPQSYENPAYCQCTNDGSGCQRPKPHYRKSSSDYYSYT